MALLLYESLELKSAGKMVDSSKLLDKTSTLYIYSAGLTWRDCWGRFHRREGPSYIYSRGCGRYLYGELHCIDKPAVVKTDGSKYWYFNDLIHRIGGPAITYSDGTEEYWEHGVRKSHRHF